jgi:hypothetical protein
LAAFFFTIRQKFVEWQDLFRDGFIQHLFRTCLLEPNGEETLPYLKNFANGYCEIKRLIVAYHKQRNLKNLLFSRRFGGITGKPVSSFFPPLDPPTQPQEQPEP